MTLLRRILAYNWKFYLLAVFCFAVFWHVFSVVGILRQTERELASSLRQNAFPLERAILENDVVKAKQVLWQIRADRIHRLVFRSDLSSESDRIFEELIVGPPPRSVLAASVRRHPVVVNGAKIGHLEWTIDYIRLNREILTDNAVLFATVTAFFSLLMVLSNLGAMRTLMRLEESVSAANRLIAEGAQGSLQDKIAAQLKAVPQEGIGAPFTALMGQVVTALQHASRKETELALAKALSEAAAQVAHDIRSPLTALEVAAADADRLPEEKRALIRMAVGRIRGIADSLLDRNRAAGAGSAAEGPSTQSLAILLHSIIAEKRLQFRPTPSVGVDAEFDATSYAALASVQPVEFKRLVSNLVNNAAESLADGAGTVSVGLSARDGSAVVRVRDDGKGIPPEVLSRLGRRGETHGKAGGSGLGLHHARACAESWGGRLDIASEPGKGTAVTLTLPLAAAPDWFVPELALTPGRAVVILDDDESIHQVWRGRLKALNAAERGVDVVHASAPRDLRGWVRSNAAKAREALYLLDQELSGHAETGLSLAEELGIGDRAVLVTSRHEDAAILAGCLKLGTRMIPKELASLAPMRIAPGGPRDAVLIDDDPLARMTWTLAASRAGSRLSAFSTLAEFLAAAPGIDRLTPVYIDAELGDGVDGARESLRIRDLGFGTVYLATGHPASAFSGLAHLAGVVGKEPPWA